MNSIKLCFLVLSFTFILGTNTLASSNIIPDRIIYDGNSYPLSGLPMEKYFAKFPNKRPKIESFSTATQTGYVATLEFVENELFLKDFQLVVGFGTIGKSILSELFPDDKKLKVDWLDQVIFNIGKGVQIEKGVFINDKKIVIDLIDGKISKLKEFVYNSKTKEFVEK
ncbi:MAG: hypothetical protein AAB336_09180 [Acidobacteriota bacterium]